MYSISRQVLRRFSVTPKPALDYLPLLLKATGDLPSAKNELRWLQEHVNKTVPADDTHKQQSTLLELCKRREQHEPLQYILDSQPFGELEIKCRRGVLIPRPETEAYTTHVSRLLNSDRLSKLITQDFGPQPKVYKRGKLVNEETTLNIVDLCSGTGCISLLLHAQLREKFPRLSINGWDISPEAIALAEENLRFNVDRGNLLSSAEKDVNFHQANIFSPSEENFQQIQDADIIISNPPYISREKLTTETTQSVREWEPELALVPPDDITLYNNRRNPPPKYEDAPEDIFYAQLLIYHARRGSCRALIMEVGDDQQAFRVVAMALKKTQITANNRIEIWRDFPDQLSFTGQPPIIHFSERKIPIFGEGKMRAVVIVAEKGREKNKSKRVRQPNGKLQLRRKEQKDKDALKKKLMEEDGGKYRRGVEVD